MTVSSQTVGIALSQDAFSAMTIEESYAESQAAAGATRMIGDDYPWAGAKTESEGGGLSPLRYYYRECVDFVAFRLNRDAGTPVAPFKYTWANMTSTGGDASAWKKAWDTHGWTTSPTPVVGAVAWWARNHVAYVSAVNPDGTVLIEEYNIGGRHAYGTRTIAPSSVDLFLYPPS